MENVGIFYAYLVYFKAIGNILLPFGIFCGHLVYFPRFGLLYKEKSVNPNAPAKTLKQFYRHFSFLISELLVFFTNSATILPPCFQTLHKKPSFFILM
jgi:hypothetical protein